MGRKRKGAWLGRKRKAAVWGSVLVFVILLMGGAYMVMGTTVYSAADYKQLDLSDVAGAAVAVSGLRATDNTLYFTPAGDAAVLILTLDAQFRDLSSQVNHIYVDLSGISAVPATSTNATVAKVYLTDGSYELALGTIDLGGSKAREFWVKGDDYRNFNDFAYVKIKIVFYDDQGTIQPYIAGSSESSIVVDAKVKLDTSTVNAFIASGIMAMVVATRKVLHAVGGAISAVGAAIVTNSALLTLVLPLTIFFFGFTQTGKSVRRKLGI